MHNVTQRRKELGLSLQAAAVAAGLSIGALWRIEKGRNQPRLGTARRIATALDTTVDELFPEAAA